MSSETIILLVFLDLLACHILAWLLGRSIGLRIGERDAERMFRYEP